MPVIGMAVDLIAPSLPAIADSLHISSATAKNIISIYILGFGIGNFFTGFLTDTLGRQKLMRINLVAFIIVSLIPVFFASIEPLLFARFLQGITLGAIAVLLRSTCIDILPNDKFMRLAPILGAMWGLGPVIGPVLGGYLQTYFGWKAGFVFFALISLISFIAIFFIVPETHFNRTPLNIKTIQKNLAEILSHRLFLGATLLMGLSYSLIIVFNTMGPFLIQTVFHYSPIFFGHLALWLGLAFILATFICRHLLQTYQIETLYFGLINMVFIISLLLLGIGYFFSDSIVITALASGLMFFVCGFIFPMSMGKGAALFRHIVGTAGALMYLLNMCIVSLIAFLVSFIHVHNFMSLMGVYFLLVFGAVLVYWLLVFNTRN
jgi:MFS family permease